MALLRACALSAIWLCLAAGPLGEAAAETKQPNIVLFVADGMRAAAVSSERAPNLAKLREQGVNFVNSHSLFPTITTANASVIATGHLMGDTGDFGNTFYTGFPVLSANRTVTPFIQNNAVLAELNQHHGGNFIAERSVMRAAREKGYHTAALGKVGPVGIHDLTELGGKTTIFFDDDTGKPDGIVLTPQMIEALEKAGLPLATPGRAQRENPGKSTNHIQQKYYRDIVTKVLLPHYKETGKPFMLLYWSSDPDGTQHSHRDSDGAFVPGINGPTSLAAIRVADDDFGAIVSTLKELGLDADTNIVVTADHGFSTISKQSKTSAAAKQSYEKIPAGHLPPGFLAIDLAEALGLNVYEPFLSGEALDIKAGKYPRRASAILAKDPAKPQVVIAANGGNDLIYFPNGNGKELAPKVIKALLAQDYTSGIFVDNALGRHAGTLPLSAVGLKGGARTPTPAIIVNFRSETSGCDEPLFCAVTVCDTTLVQGQGHHGSFSRADTANFMAAIGPAFKAGHVNTSPVGNADIAPTLARILGVELPSLGRLKGRVISEALQGGKPVRVWRRDLVSEPGDNGLRTIVNLQFVGNTPYFDAAGFAGRTVGLRAPEEKQRVSAARR